jgi:dihydroorotate dehydrogenase electron transfer subunit
MAVLLQSRAMPLWNGDAKVVRQERRGAAWMLTLDVPNRDAVEAGQFCHILVEPGRTDPLLRRPFSYWDVRPGGEGSTHVDLLYTVVGKGTRLLETKRPGDVVGYLGPLGIGFTPKPAATTWVFVAGGVGIVPFYALAKQARARGGMSPRMLLLFGGRTQSMLYGIDDFPGVGVEAVAATEDGSRGSKGLVTKLLEERLKELNPATTQVYTCGPDRMMSAVMKIALAAKLPCEASMERHMGCALGACGACVTKVVDDGPDGWRYSRICVEGPTYDACRLVLE